MKGDLGIIEIHHRESKAAEVTGRGVEKNKTGGLKTQHKYYFHFMGVGGGDQLLAEMLDLNLNVTAFFFRQNCKLISYSEPLCLFSIFASSSYVQ